MSEILLINPRKRRRRKSSRGRKRNPAYVMNRSRRRSRRGRKRNPSFRTVGAVTRNFLPQVMNAGKNAAGALLTDAAYTYLPLPGFLKTGPLAMVSRALTAFAVSFLSSYAVGGKMAGQFLEGALTVQAYAALRPMVAGFIPLAGHEIEGLGFYSPGMILQDDLSPLTDLNAGTSLQGMNAYISGLGEGGTYDESIEAYIS